MENMAADIALLQQIVQGSNSLVFFGGAGVSTESGIPDFRSAGGLYSQTYAYPPETMLSHSFYTQHKKEFFPFYRENMLCLDAKPNAAHLKLAQMEKAGKLQCVITQNIDGLHQKAGSEKVIELHGSVHRNYCELCGKAYTAEYVLHHKEIPKCTCGGDIKPDVVLYEEPLNERAIKTAIQSIKDADVLIIGGTSLVVYPAAGFIQHFSGRHLVVINKSSTEADRLATLAIHGPIGQILHEIQI